ncbi:MAG: acyl-CoA dehydrogenase family protein [Planctomycetes bacterium]|nr:acyl-CoA dehydrogenase family protein [Planctomycetota bacterium]
MVSFDLSPEQMRLIEKTRAFADEHVRPVARKHDLSCEFPWEVIRAAYSAGIINGAIPREYGGAGHSAFDGCLASEELGAACTGIGICIDANNLALTPLLIGGTPEQKQRLFGDLVDRRGLAAFALTEPDAGSDAGAIKTVARLSGDRYVINGKKRFITNGKQALYHTVFASTDPERGARGLSAIVVPVNTPGVVIGRELPKMGQRASCQVEVEYRDVEVPAENRIGKEGHGFLLAMKTFNRTRAGVAAAAIGLAREAYEVSRKWAMGRQQFGQSVASFEGIQFMFAEMLTEITAARLLTWNAAFLVDADREVGTMSAMAKYYSTDVAMKAATDAVQIMGGEGYSQDQIVEKLMRDAKLSQIYEGTNQVQRYLIAKNTLK